MTGDDIPEKERRSKDKHEEIWWAEDLEKIQNPVLRERSIQEATNLEQEAKDLDAKIESGEGDPVVLQMERVFGLGLKKSRAATRAGLASQDVTYDHLGDVAEDYDHLPGDVRTLELKDKLQEQISRDGPEKSRQRADRMLEAGELSEKGHQFICRQTRLQQIEEASEKDDLPSETEPDK